MKRQKSKLYIGYSEDLKRRLREHAGGEVYTTARMISPRLVYYEAYQDSESAKNQERKLKQYGSAYHGLLKRLGARVPLVGE